MYKRQTYNPVEGVTLTQIIEYPINSSIIRRSWEITNESGAAKSDVRFIHGGDTYFAGSDSGYCYYDNLNNMVYIRKDADSGTMAFSGDPSSPADQYYTGRYNVGVSQACLLYTS